MASMMLSEVTMRRFLILLVVMAFLGTICDVIEPSLEFLDQTTSIHHVAVARKSDSLRYLERIPRTCTTTNNNSNNNSTVSVAIFPSNCTARCGELVQFLIEGVNYSDCLTKTRDYLHASVWLVDTHRMPETEMISILKERLDIPEHDHVTIYHVDYGDNPQKTIGGVFDYGSLVKSRPNTSKTTSTDSRFTAIYYKRSIVENRKMGLSVTGNESVGSIRRYPHVTNHIPYGVRTDMVEVFNAQIMTLLGKRVRYKDTSMISATTPLHPSMVEHLRIHGVRSFWPANKSDAECAAYRKSQRKAYPKGLPSGMECNYNCLHDGAYRCQVSTTLLHFLSNLTKNDTASSLRLSPYRIVKPLIEVGITGFNADAGRASPQLPYVCELLSYKIVVVSQRDEWEGHYRLMEAMMGGGLVLHDVMLAPPGQLVDGLHYVIYHSMNDLLEKVMYYLTHEEERRAIADRGWIQAMTHYRSWHLVEAMILDNIEMVR